MLGRCGRSFVTSLLAALVSAPASASVLSQDNLDIGRAAFAAIDRGHWTEARRAAGKASDPVLRDLVVWFDLARSGGDPAFDDLADFLERRPRWPNQTVLLRRAEHAIDDDVAPERIVRFFDDRRPLTAEGRTQLARALVQTGRTEEARRVVRETWVGDRFSLGLERGFLNRFDQFLEPDDHVRRLDGLLWDGRYREAERMLERVSGDMRALATARLRLRRMQPAVDAAIARVPDHLKTDPGLVFERVRWRRQKGRYLEARTLLQGYAADHIRPELWWNERVRLARDALSAGHISEAYRLARDHALHDGADFAEAEWLAGWIAFRFLDEPSEALERFAGLFERVRYPISRARSAYWSARAAEAANRPNVADLWYRAAAQHPTAYYGQLAAARLAPGRGLRLPPEPHPSAREVVDIEDSELRRAVKILDALGERERATPFLLALADLGDTPGWKALVAEYASDLGRADAAATIARRANETGRPLIRHGYPVVPVPAADGRLQSPVDVPLVLAMIRQESAFRTDAQSGQGARGLMQLLPSTARAMAKKLNLAFSTKRLSSDADYNLLLGQRYLSELLSKFDGSLVLALAAYNAGPYRVRTWIRDYGDPRDADVDVIDWIELIPFYETRNYVQRVLEQLQVYRGKTGGQRVALLRERDLKR